MVDGHGLVAVARVVVGEAFPAASSTATPIESACPHERFENEKVVVVHGIVVTTAPETEIR